MEREQPLLVPLGGKDQSNGSQSTNEKLPIDSQDIQKYSPFFNILYYSIGPLLLVIQALGEFFDLLMISKQYNKTEVGSTALQILGFSNQITETLGFIGLFLGFSGISQIISLYRQNQFEDSHRLLIDILYFTVIFTLFFSFIFSFIITPIFKFLKAPDSILKNAYAYTIPFIFSSPFSNILHCIQFILFSIGSTILSGFISLAQFILQVCVLSPLLLFGIKVSSTFMKFGRVISEIIISIIALILLFKKKLTVQPKASDIFTSFSSRTPKIILPSLIFLLEIALFIFIPLFVFHIIISKSELNIITSDFASFYALFSKIYTVIISGIIAFSISFINLGSHIINEKPLKTFLHYFLYSVLLSLIISILFSFIFIISKKSLSKLVFNEDSKIELTNELLSIPLYTISLLSIPILIASAFIIIQKNLISLILIAIHSLILIVSVLLLKTKNGNIKSIMYAYNIADSITTCLSLFLYPLFKKFFSEINNVESDNLSSSSKLVQEAV